MNKEEKIYASILGVILVAAFVLLGGAIIHLSKHAEEKASHYTVTVDGKTVHQDAKIYVGGNSGVLYVTDEEGNEFVYPSNWKAFKRVENN